MIKVCKKIFLVLVSLITCPKKSTNLRENFEKCHTIPKISWYFMELDIFVSHWIMYWCHINYVICNSIEGKVVMIYLREEVNMSSSTLLISHNKQEICLICNNSVLCRVVWLEVRYCIVTFIFHLSHKFQHRKTHILCLESFALPLTSNAVCEFIEGKSFIIFRCVLCHCWNQFILSLLCIIELLYLWRA